MQRDYRLRAYLNTKTNTILQDRVGAFEHGNSSADYNAFLIYLFGIDNVVVNDPTSFLEFTFDRQLSRKSGNRVLTSKFGDGYEQSVLDGINTKEDSFEVSFKNHVWQEVEFISAYLDSMAAKSFEILVGTKELHRVRCDEYNTTYHYNEVYSLNATFRRVYSV